MFKRTDVRGAVAEAEAHGVGFVFEVLARQLEASPGGADEGARRARPKVELAGVLKHRVVAEGVLPETCRVAAVHQPVIAAAYAHVTAARLNELVGADNHVVSHLHRRRSQGVVAYVDEPGGIAAPNEDGVPDEPKSHGRPGASAVVVHHEDLPAVFRALTRDEHVPPEDHLLGRGPTLVGHHVDLVVRRASDPVVLDERRDGADVQVLPAAGVVDVVVAHRDAAAEDVGAVLRRARAPAVADELAELDEGVFAVAA